SITIPTTGNVHHLSRALRRQREWEPDSDKAPSLDIFMSAFVGDHHAVSWYLDRDPNLVNSRDALWHPPLHYACGGQDPDGIKSLLLAKVADEEARNCARHTPSDYSNPDQAYLKAESFFILRERLSERIDSKQPNSILSYNTCGRTALHRIGANS